MLHTTFLKISEGANLSMDQTQKTNKRAIWPSIFYDSNMQGVNENVRYMSDHEKTPKEMDCWNFRGNT